MYSTLGKDKLEICGFGLQSKVNVSNMQVFHEDVKEAYAGQNVGVNIRGVKKDELRKDMLLIKPDSVELSNHFDVLHLHTHI